MDWFLDHCIIKFGDICQKRDRPLTQDQASINFLNCLFNIFETQVPPVKFRLDMFTLLAVACAIEVSTEVPITTGAQFCGWDGKSAIELSYTQGGGWLVVDSNESLTVTVGRDCTPGAECSNLRTWYAQYLDGVFFIGPKRAVVRIFASRDRDVSFAAGYLDATTTTGQSCTNLHIGAVPATFSKGTHCVVNSQLRETKISGEVALPATVTVNVYSTDGSVTEFKSGTQIAKLEGRLSTAIHSTDGTEFSVTFDFNDPPYSQASLTQTSKNLPGVALWPASGLMINSLVMGSCERAAYCSTPIHFEGGDIAGGENLALDVGLALGIPAAFAIVLCSIMIGLTCKCACSCQRQESVQETFDLPPPTPDFNPPNPDTLQP